MRSIKKSIEYFRSERIQISCLVDTVYRQEIFPYDHVGNYVNYDDLMVLNLQFVIEVTFPSIATPISRRVFKIDFGIIQHELSKVPGLTIIFGTVEVIFSTMVWGWFIFLWYLIGTQRILRQTSGRWKSQSSAIGLVIFVHIQTNYNISSYFFPWKPNTNSHWVLVYD